MKHNGNLQVTGRLASRKVIVGSFSGTTLTSGSYELPYPLGNVGSVFTITTNISGDKVLSFTNLDADTLTYSPANPGDWVIVPTTVSEGLDNLSAAFDNHNHVIESLSTTELDNTYILQPNGSGGVIWKPSGDINLTNFYNKTEVNAISGYLQSEITVLDAQVQQISANLGSSTFTGLADTPNSYASKAGEFVTVNNTEDGVEFTPVLYGIISCDTINQAYTVSNAKLTSNSIPTATLVIPTSGENWLGMAISNIRSGAFDITLTGIPAISGYKITWSAFNNI